MLTGIPEIDEFEPPAGAVRAKRSHEIPEHESFELWRLFRRKLFIETGGPPEGFKEHFLYRGYFANHEGLVWADAIGRSWMGVRP